jgi:hypothetical protein
MANIKKIADKRGFNDKINVGRPLKVTCIEDNK